MDLDTLIIIVYVMIADWYREQQQIKQMKERRGRPSQFTDEEMLTCMILSEWRANVPWQSERGFLRYMHQHYSSWFPQLPQRSAFNRRKRYLWGVMVELCQQLAELLSSPRDVFECVDGCPLPAGSLGQYSREKGHWLGDSTIGHGKNGQWFWGDTLLMAVARCGAITGWVIGAAHVQERWLMEVLLSTRSGIPTLHEPMRRQREGKRGHRLPPYGFIGGFQAAGKFSHRPYLADQNFTGWFWHIQWRQSYHAQVITVPPFPSIHHTPWQLSEKKWLYHYRQIVETVFAVLQAVFDIKHLNAHSRWGQYTRLATKTAAFNLGMWLNRLLNRPLLALETLLC